MRIHNVSPLYDQKLSETKLFGEFSLKFSLYRTSVLTLDISAFKSQEIKCSQSHSKHSNEVICRTSHCRQLIKANIMNRDVYHQLQCR